jgi:hypothetical protein
VLDVTGGGPVNNQFGLTAAALRSRYRCVPVANPGADNCADLETLYFNKRVRHASYGVKDD